MYIIFHFIACVFPLLIVSLPNRTSGIPSLSFSLMTSVIVSKKSSPTQRQRRYSSRRSFETLLFYISYLYHNPSGIGFCAWSEVGCGVPSHGTPVDPASGFCYSSTVLLLSFSYYSTSVLLSQTR